VQISEHEETRLFTSTWCVGFALALPSLPPWWPTKAVNPDISKIELAREWFSGFGWSKI
jgi:hypothetical protein